MAYEFLQLSDAQNAVARLTLRREKKKNALCMAMRDELEDAFAALVRNEAVNAVVLAGGDGIFCAGYDLKEGAESGGTSFLHRFREFFGACYLFPKPMVAAVDGPALAGGFDLALTADFIVASTRAVFGHPEIEFGPVAIVPLARFVSPARLRELCLLGANIDAETAKAFVSPARLRELCLLGANIDAETAKAYGIVHQIVEPSQTEAAATALAETLAAKPPAGLAATKSAICAYLHSGEMITGDSAGIDAVLAEQSKG
jgi:enoyl-CoA hydratase/carnithine racemase